MIPPKLDLHKLPGEMQFTLSSAQHVIDTWYDKHIVPMFENAKIVYSSSIEDVWFESHKVDIFSFKLKGLVINIQPIKEETAEDILREFIEECSKTPIGSYIPSANILFKARKLLDKNET